MKYSNLVLQPRKLSYSRHEISDGDASTAGINYKVHMQVRRMMSEGRIRHRRNKHATANGTTISTSNEVPILPATITHGKRVTGSAKVNFDYVLFTFVYICIFSILFTPNFFPKVLQDDNIRNQLKESRSNAGLNEDDDDFISFSTKRPFKPGDMEDSMVHGKWMLRKQSKYFDRILILRSFTNFRSFNNSTHSFFGRTLKCN